MAIPSIGALLWDAVLFAASTALGMLNHTEGPRLQDTKGTTADYGTPLNYFYGDRKLGTVCFFTEDIKERKKTRKGKGGKQTEYTYYGTFAVAVADHEISSVKKVWFDNHLVYDASATTTLFPLGDGYELSSSMRLYTGTEAQEPDARMLATIEAKYGAGTCPAYRGVAYLFFEDIPLEKLGNRFPQVTVEASTSGGGATSADEDIVTGLTGGFTEYNQAGYQALHTSPNGTYSVLGGQGLGGFNSRTLRFTNTRGAYDRHETDLYNVVNSLGRGWSDALVDNAGNVYVFDGNSAMETVKFDSSGSITRLSAIADTNKVPVGIYDVGGTEYLVYGGPVSGDTSKLYIRDLSSGTTTMVDSATATGGTAIRSAFVAQDAAGDVWAWGVPYADTVGSTSETALTFWRVINHSGSGANYHTVSGFPSETAKTNWPAAFGFGKICVMWATLSKIVVIDQATWTVETVIDPTTLIGTADWFTGNQPSTGAAIPAIDTTAGDLILYKYDSGDPNYPVTDVYRISMADWSLKSTQPISAFGTMPPSGTASTYPYQIIWDDSLRAHVALPFDPSSTGTAPDGSTSRPMSPADFAFLYDTAPDVTLGAILSDIADRSGLTTEEYDFTALDQVVPGYSWTQGTGKQIGEPLLNLYDSDVRPHDFALEGIKRTGTSGGTITTSEVVSANPLYKLNVTNDTDLPRRVFFNFADVDADQQPNSVVSQRSLSAVDSAREQSIDMSTVALDVATAKQFADRMFRRTWFARTSGELALTRQRLDIEPGDVRTIILDDETKSYRCNKLTISANGTLQGEWIEDDTALAAFSGAAGAVADGITPSVLFDPVASAGYVLDLPLLSDAHDQTTPFTYLAAGPAAEGTWPGADIAESDSGETGTYAMGWDAVSTSESAVIGTMASTLPNAVANIIDYGSSVSVVIDAGTLTSSTESAVLNDGAVNLALIGDEVVQFITATLTAPLTYTLTGLVRGSRGTEWAMASHGASERFVMLADAKKHTLGASAIGGTSHYIVTSLGLSPDEGDAVSVSFTGAAHKPYSPVGGTITASGSDYLINATRRTRIGGSTLNGSDVPLGEASESWSADIMDGSTVKRTITGTSLPLTYTAAQITADWGGTWSTKSVNLYQVNPTLSLRGFALNITA